MKYVVLFILTALYIAELFVLIPVFMLLQLITGKDYSDSNKWLVDWFYNYAEINTI